MSGRNATTFVWWTVNYQGRVFGYHDCEMEGWVLKEGNVGQGQAYGTGCEAVVVVLEGEHVFARGEDDEGFEAAVGDGPSLDWEYGRGCCVLGGDAQEVFVGVGGDALPGDEDTAL